MWSFFAERKRARAAREQQERAEARQRWERQEAERRQYWEAMWNDPDCPEEVCRCECHITIACHCKPCCYACPNCQLLIRDGLMAQHVPNCGQFHALTPPWSVS